MIGAGVGGAGYGVCGKLLWGARGGASAGYGMGAEAVWGARGAAGVWVIPTGPGSRGYRLGVAAPLRHAVRRATPRPSLVFAPASMAAAGPFRGRRAVAAPLLLARLPGSRYNQRLRCLPHAQAGEQEGMASEKKEEPKTPLIEWEKVKRAVENVIGSPTWKAFGGLVLFAACAIIGYSATKGNSSAQFVVDVLDKANKVYKPSVEFVGLVIKIVLLFVKSSS